jgi:hypothetical protein
MEMAAGGVIEAHLDKRGRSRRNAAGAGAFMMVLLMCYWGHCSADVLHTGHIVPCGATYGKLCSLKNFNRAAGGISNECCFYYTAFVCCFTTLEAGTLRTDNTGPQPELAF